MIKKRDVAIAIIFSILTCGIYGIYWFIVLTDDAKVASEDNSFQSGGVAFLLTIITCGIYGLYWAYKMGDLIKTTQIKKGMPVNDYGILYLILQFFGFSIINYALMQNDLNKIADAN